MAQRYDLAIIGSGPGGYVAAVRAAQLGFKTVCIDKREVPGGTCLNIGCIPSKALLHSSEFYAKCQKESQEQGVQFSELSYDFKQMMHRKEGIVKGLVDSVAHLFERYHVDFVKGEASFKDEHTLEVKQGSHSQEIEANAFLLATGSESIALSALPFDERQIVSSTGALSLPRVPKHLAVIGAGIIGVELASVYSRLGAKVTIVEMLDRICPTLDLALSRQLLQVLRKQGMEFWLSSKVVTAVKQPDEVILTVDKGDQLANLSADVVLVAVGRRPYSQGLGLDKIGIEINDRGFVRTDRNFRTSQPHILAIGDLIEGPMLAHRASEEGISAIEILAGRRPRINYLAIPNVVYTHPEVASVGLTEQEARDAQLSIRVGTCPFRANPRARCMGELDGFVKVIGEEITDRLLGIHIIGAHASELIAEGMLAMEQGISMQELAQGAYAHPTLSEAVKEAALSALGRAIHL